VISRQGFGLSVAYLVLACITEPSQWCPSYWLKKFLSLRFWLPIATLSYSIYLFHLAVIQFIAWVGGVHNLFNKDKDREIYIPNCQETLEPIMML